MESIIAKIREELEIHMDVKTRESCQHFFREKINCYGVKTPVTSRIGKTWFKQIKNVSKSRIFELCELLWQSGTIEESFIACNWSFYIHEQYEATDILVFKNWIQHYVNNWASCDSLCNHSVGKLIEMYPECIPGLKDFTKSENRWMRRAAAVSFILPARKGKFLSDILEIADVLLYDKDDLVQKGYGWMLKAASESHQQAIFDYVIQNKSMPRTALRYAIEKMPKEMKAIAMKK